MTDASEGDMTSLVTLFEEGRRREKEQTLFYRALAAIAEDEGQHAESERLNGLHADEQHHLSRLTARLLEIGAQPADLRGVARPSLPDDDWEDEARAREMEEVAWYESALEAPVLDPETAEVFREILESERHHVESLGGKWMPA